MVLWDVTMGGKSSGACMCQMALLANVQHLQSADISR